MKYGTHAEPAGIIRRQEEECKMMLSEKYLKRLVKEGKARYIGKTRDCGWRWAIVERLDKQRIDHYRIERIIF